MKCLLFFALLLSSTQQLLATDFTCPVNFPCYCMRSEDDETKHKVHCVTSEITSTAFDLTIQSSRLVRIQCVNSPDWSDFLMGASMNVGVVPNLQFVGCEMPGKNFSESVVNQLGISGVEILKVEKLRGGIGKADLDVFPELKKLLLTGNQLSDVPADLLYGLPKLSQLDMRGTQIKLPAAGFFKYSSSLTSLELSQNDLHDLQPGIFDGLQKIELLNMWNSNISTLHPNIFRGLSTLASLDIKMNHLRTLPNDIFNDLVNLKVLNFGFNNFTELPANLFSQNRRLKIVKLMHNRVNITRLPDRFLSDLTDLRVVSLERIGLHDVPKNLLWGSDGILELNVNRNYLTTLPADLLRDARSLHKLSLSFNDLRVLPDGVFSSLKKLVSLDLSRNHLGVISEDLLYNMDSLQELNLDQNDLKWIDVDALSSLGTLRVAKLSNNQLDLRTDMHDLFGELSPFYNCTRLEELYLSHNNITKIYADWTVAHVHLRKLDLSYNAIEVLQTEDLQFIADKMQVDLTHNEISSVDLSRLEFIAGEQNSSRHVIVDLNHNPIYCDCELYSLLRYIHGEMHPRALYFVTLRMQQLTCEGPKYLSGTRLLDIKSPELKCVLEDDDLPSNDACGPDGICDCWLRPSDQTLILDCAGRNLTKAPASIVVGNANHVEIDLSNNLLRVAPNLTETGYQLVRNLNLTGNLIEYINESLISPNLKVLKLDGNKLSSIDESILRKISNLNMSLLTLHNNPWNCDCKAGALVNFVQTNAKILATRDNITCILDDRSLCQLQPFDYCPYPLYLYIIGLVLLTALLVGIPLVLYVKYNQEIKIFLYSRDMCLWFITQEELDRDKIYDAFISYSHEDEDFVKEELLKNLEGGRQPYKICIHERDWAIGNLITDNILRSVDESRRTIIVLSTHFIESKWCQAEFKAARDKIVEDKSPHLIVILYGDVDPAKIVDPHLRTYLKMNTYLKWGDSSFYQKLRYALPHKYKLSKEIMEKSKLDDWHINGQPIIEQVKVC